MNKIPFNKPYLVGKEFEYLAEAHKNGILAGDGPFTKKCQSWISSYAYGNKSLLTHSCTAALEMAAMLLDIEPGDEVIMPSFTFVSTANAFVLRGGVPVFVDIRPDTMNLDEKLVEQAITTKTKAIVVVHYAGVSAEMDTILRIAKKYGLKVVEDSAQALMSKYKGLPLGSIGDLGALSFHETKNVISGEGGALVINNENFNKRAEIIREKGTNRAEFYRGDVDKYTWKDIGSSFLPGEIVAAFLLAQLENALEITQKRLILWHNYYDLLSDLEKSGKLTRQFVPQECSHNAHMFYLILNKEIDRQTVLDRMKDKRIQTVFHYVPLHSSPAGIKYGKTSGDLKITNIQSKQLVRLPLWVGMTHQDQLRIVTELSKVI